VNDEPAMRVAHCFENLHCKRKRSRIPGDVIAILRDRNPRRTRAPNRVPRHRSAGHRRDARFRIREFRKYRAPEKSAPDLRVKSRMGVQATLRFQTPSMRRHAKPRHAAAAIRPRVDKDRSALRSLERIVVLECSRRKFRHRVQEVAGSTAAWAAKRSRKLFAETRPVFLRRESIQLLSIGGI